MRSVRAAPGHKRRFPPRGHGGEPGTARPGPYGSRHPSLTEDLFARRLLGHALSHELADPVRLVFWDGLSLVSLTSLTHRVVRLVRLPTISRGLIGLMRLP